MKVNCIYLKSTSKSSINALNIFPDTAHLYCFEKFSPISEVLFGVKCEGTLLGNCLSISCTIFYESMNFLLIFYEILIKVVLHSKDITSAIEVSLFRTLTL